MKRVKHPPPTPCGLEVGVFWLTLIKALERFSLLIVILICLVAITRMVNILDMKYFVRRGVEDIVLDKVKQRCPNSENCEKLSPNIYEDFDFSIVAGPFEVARYDFYDYTDSNKYELFITKIDYGPTPNGEYGYVLMGERGKDKSKHYRYRVIEYSLSAGEGYNVPKGIIGVEEIEKSEHIPSSYVFKVGNDVNSVTNTDYQLFTGSNVRYANDNKIDFTSEIGTMNSNDAYIYTKYEGLNFLFE